MAGVVVGPDFDLATFHEQLGARLPEYARPLFVRFLAKIEMTGTFKAKKDELAQAGYDPARTTDPICLNDRARRAFVPLDAAVRGHSDPARAGVAPTRCSRRLR